MHSHWLYSSPTERKLCAGGGKRPSGGDELQGEDVTLRAIADAHAFQERRRKAGHPPAAHEAHAHRGVLLDLLLKKLEPAELREIWDLLRSEVGEDLTGNGRPGPGAVRDAVLTLIARYKEDNAVANAAQHMRAALEKVAAHWEGQAAASHPDDRCHRYDVLVPHAEALRVILNEYDEPRAPDCPAPQLEVMR